MRASIVLMLLEGNGRLHRLRKQAGPNTRCLISPKVGGNLQKITDDYIHIPSIEGNGDAMIFAQHMPGDYISWSLRETLEN